MSAIPSGDSPDELLALGREVADLGRDLGAVIGRTSVLEQQRRGDQARADELVGAIREHGDRLRGTHGVAVDTASAVNALGVAVKDLRAHLGAVQLAVEVLVKRKTRGPAALARKARRRKP